MYLMKKFVKYVHLDLFYILDYSGSFDMHIEKLYFFCIFRCPVLAVRGGGVESYGV